MTCKDGPCRVLGKGACIVLDFSCQHSSSRALQLPAPISDTGVILVQSEDLVIIDLGKAEAGAKGQDRNQSHVVGFILPVDVDKAKGDGFPQRMTTEEHCEPASRGDTIHFQSFHK